MLQHSKGINTIESEATLDNNFRAIERIYRPRFTNVVYCLTGSSQATEEILKEIFARIATTLNQCSPTPAQQYPEDQEQWLCLIALNVTNTWLESHTHVLRNNHYLPSLTS